MFKTIEWTADGVRMIDQLKLPTQEVYVTCRTYQEVAEAIRTMIIRGAPAIGVAAAMGVALGVKRTKAQSVAELRAEFEIIAETISKTRPTAVNLFWAVKRMRGVFEKSLASASSDAPAIASAKTNLEDDFLHGSKLIAISAEEQAVSPGACTAKFLWGSATLPPVPTCASRRASFPDSSGRQFQAAHHQPPPPPPP